MFKWFCIYHSNFITCLSVTNIIINAAQLLCRDKSPWQAQERIGSLQSIWPTRLDFRSELLQNVFRDVGWKQDGPQKTWLFFWFLPSFVQQIHIEGLWSARPWPWNPNMNKMGCPCPQEAGTQLRGRKERCEEDRWLFRFNGRLKCCSNSKVVLSPIYFEYFYSSI